MAPLYTPFVKSKDAEAKALSNLAPSISQRIVPLIEVDRPPTEKIPKYMSDSSTPTIAYLDRTLGHVINMTWQGPVMVDTYQWRPNATVETGANVISYVIAALRSHNLAVIPVVGYDRWEDLAYREAMSLVPPGPAGKVAIRLDTFAISDAAEPDLFTETIANILDELGIAPAQCAILIDFGDISGDSSSVLEVFAGASRIIDILQEWGFDYFSIAGCSLPPSIDLAVPTQDADAPVLRKEMVAWQMLREQYSDISIASGDYCVRGPTTTSAPVKHINGKIRYAIPRHHYVVRGHSRILDGGFGQMYNLAGRLIASGHFLGSEFSWGDSEMALAAAHIGSCAPKTWIALDTSHHVTHMVHEVLEFERVLALRNTENARV